MNEELLFFSKDLKVLCVEDDLSLLNEMKQLFEDFFKEVDTASNGEIALELYKQKQFDIIISDIKMPKIDGITLSKKIKKINKDQEIIIISAYNDSENLLNLIKIGISDFILKPMDFEQLFQVFYKVSKNIYYKKENEKFLIQQSKMAQIGEMVDMIAHQWIQFLNVLNIKAEFINIQAQNHQLDEEIIKKYTSENIKEIDELMKILQEFRNFFKEKPKEKVDLKEIIDSSLLLINDYLLKNLIQIENNVSSELLEIYPNEFKQVIINILTNMVENFNERKIKVKKIKLYNKNSKLYLEDNGGGIDEAIQHKVFDKDFTTKKTGSGKGLYLSKLIMNKIGGDIKIENIDNGVRFIINFNKN